ncbi:MAG: STAS domain-containing protein [Spirochaetaceae bacterium]|jgi:SulP family sulfate permease|nr:STAS domain-containing protein [Spirochaetaceae bacterium]
MRFPSFFDFRNLTPRTAELFRDKQYSVKYFGKDCVSGFIVGVVALPLAMAFSIASGGTPAQGLWTAIIAGFFVSALGGSRFQIGGPTGAFVIIIFGVIAKHGMSGLIAATVIAGILLCVMGIFGLGTFIKYIPYPVTTGFTTGIGVLIFSGQVKDFLGLRIENSSPEFFTKWFEYIKMINTIDMATVSIGMGTLIIIILVRIFSPRIPGAVAGVFFVTILAYFGNIHIETIATRFGGIPSGIPVPEMPYISWEVVVDVFPSAVTIALLSAIESLLSAVVADSMTGDVHNSNTELIAQGIGNIASGVFGCIPATGAIARTATNIKAGAVSPVSGVMHSVTLVLFVLFFSGAASQIPLACLSAVLMAVSWDMSNMPRFIRIIKTAPKSDISVLITTFVLTVIVDLTFAVEVGVVLAVFLFMRRMIEMGNIKPGNEELIKELAYGRDKTKEPGYINLLAKKNIEVYEINGPFFFGVADMLQTTLRKMSRAPEKIILRMRDVPAIDTTGIAALESLLINCKKNKTTLVITEVREQPLKALKNSGFFEAIGKCNVTRTLEDALEPQSSVLENKIDV